MPAPPAVEEGEAAAVPFMPAEPVPYYPIEIPTEAGEFQPAIAFIAPEPLGFQMQPVTSIEEATTPLGGAAYSWAEAQALSYAAIAATQDTGHWELTWNINGVIVKETLAGARTYPPSSERDFWERYDDRSPSQLVSEVFVTA